MRFGRLALAVCVVLALSSLTVSAGAIPELEFAGRVEPGYMASHGPLQLPNTGVNWVEVGIATEGGACRVGLYSIDTGEMLWSPVFEGYHGLHTFTDVPGGKYLVIVHNVGSITLKYYGYAAF